MLLKKLKILDSVDNILFCNDSVIYNTNASLEPLMEGVKLNDFYGLTINKKGYSKKLILGEDDPHIQSYFLSVSKNIFSKKFFVKFIKSIKKEKRKVRIIYKYEQGLSRTIISHGFSPLSFYPQRDNDSAYPDPYYYYLSKDSSFEQERIFYKKCIEN